MHGNTLLPITFAEQVRLSDDHFTWAFVRAGYNTWAMAHILNPFLIQMIFQKWTLTAMIFCVWESIEVLFLILLKNYSIFVGDQSDFEPIADSLVGDVINGFLGILLALLVSFTARFPRNWCPSLLDSNSKVRLIFWKRILLYVMLLLPISAYNARLHVDVDSQDLYIGVHITMLLHVLALVISWKWLDNTDTEKELFWSAESPKYEMTEEERTQYGIWRQPIPVMDSADEKRQFAYTIWISVVCIMHYSATYFITYAYYQAWLAWMFVVVFMLFLIVWQGRFGEWMKLMGYQYQRQRYYYKYRLYGDAN
jgi:hypothetical protein